MEVPKKREGLNSLFGLLNLDGSLKTDDDPTKRCSDGPAEGEPCLKKMKLKEVLLAVADLLDGEVPDNRQPAPQQQDFNVEQVVALVVQRVLDQIQTASRSPAVLYKTQICNHYCPYGKKCKYAHGHEQLGQPVRTESKNQRKKRRIEEGRAMPQAAWQPTYAHQSAFPFGQAGSSRQHAHAFPHEPAQQLAFAYASPQRQSSQRHPFQFEGVTSRAEYGAMHQSRLVFPQVPALNAGSSLRSAVDSTLRSMFASPLSRPPNQGDDTSFELPKMRSSFSLPRQPKSNLGETSLVFPMVSRLSLPAGTAAVTWQAEKTMDERSSVTEITSPSTSSASSAPSTP